MSLRIRSWKAGPVLGLGWVLAFVKTVLPSRVRITEQTYCLGRVALMQSTPLSVIHAGRP
eukprot:10152566-Lingulodinium_polyedra.AAC.1